jgi:hypothetical protein
MRAATMLIVGMMIMPNYGLMGKRASAQPGGLLATAPDSEIERLRRNGPPEPSSRLPDPPGLAELKALYAAGRITAEQFHSQVDGLLPANPYPNEPQALSRRKTK